MEFLNERVSFLRELAESLGISEQTKEGKLLLAIIETLGDVAEICGGFERGGDPRQQNCYPYMCPNCNQEIDIDEMSIENEDHIICPKCSGPIKIMTTEV